MKLKLPQSIWDFLWEVSLGNADTAEFNKQGKSVFCKFVEDIDSKLKIMDECIVVTPKDELVAFGKLIVSPKELELGQQGMAVRVRGGIGKS